MPSRLPSLNALRNFEAAARHRSLTLAANELGVTHGAISRQISNLEASLGVQLFVRGRRPLELTARAATFLVSIQRGFEIIKGASNDLLAHTMQGPLRINALPAMMSRWLLPRLRNYPDLDIAFSMATIVEPVISDVGEIDVFIQAGPSIAPRTRSYRLLDYEIVPFCHPEIVSGMPPPRSVDEFRHYALLHFLSAHPVSRPFSHDLWAQWAEAAGLVIDNQVMDYFPTFDLVYEAVLQGKGIGIGASLYIEDELAHGRVITPVEIRARSSLAYHLVIPEAKINLPKVKRFMEWVLDQSGNSLTIV